ncbi:IS5/IS1182 family transposase, partial [Priestia megaterium]
CILPYATTSREGERTYKSNPADCVVCPMRDGCFSAKQKQRTITRHIWEHFKEQARMNKRTKSGQQLYRMRCTTIERSFADAKELNGYRYARYQGKKSVQMQAYLTAACQNMKKSRLVNHFLVSS